MGREGWGEGRDGRTGTKQSRDFGSGGTSKELIHTEVKFERCLFGVVYVLLILLLLFVTLLLQLLLLLILLFSLRVLVLVLVISLLLFVLTFVLLFEFVMLSFVGGGMYW